MACSVCQVGVCIRNRRDASECFTEDSQTQRNKENGLWIWFRMKLVVIRFKMMTMSVTLDHFDMIKILCILFGCFGQHAWMSFWEPGFMNIHATCEWIANVRHQTHVCRIALCRFTAAALQIEQLQGMSLRTHRPAVQKRSWRNMTMWSLDVTCIRVRGSILL